MPPPPPRAPSLAPPSDPSFADLRLLPPPRRRRRRDGLEGGEVIDLTRSPPRRSHRRSPRPCRPTSAPSAPSPPRGGSITADSPRPTSAIAVTDTAHGAARRRQRLIARRDAQAAIRYGDRRPSRPDPRTGESRSVYAHRGRRYVVEDSTGRLVTCFGEEVRLTPRLISDAAWRRHRDAAVRARSDPNSWTSHSVMLVDVSGSMRRSDVDGARTRLGAVWVSLARDFVEHRIRSGDAADSDVVTVVLMGERAEVLFREVPTDWVLYNEIARVHGDGTVRPAGHGCYGPALTLAECILCGSASSSSSCSLVLGLLSDGRPSDATFTGGNLASCRRALEGMVERLASRLGRRLTVASVGMGCADDFSTLRGMASAAEGYGSAGTFHLPSMSCSGLGAAMTSIATSLADSRTELAGGGRGGGQRRVRQVMRENKKYIPLLTEWVDGEEFDIFMGDKVHRMEYDPAAGRSFRSAPLQHPDACGAAIKRTVFGEGAERHAFQFFEVEGDGTSVVGAPLVAKESRFVEESSECAELNWADRDRFVERFCKIQHSARSAAGAFNDKVDSIPRLDPDTARVSFLDCSVYYLTDPEDEALRDKKRWQRYVGTRIIFWDCTAAPMTGYDDATINSLLYSDYYGMCCAKGAVGQQPCGWIRCMDLFMGAAADDVYKKKSGIFAEQMKFQNEDRKEGDEVNPFCNTEDKGFRCVAEAKKWEQHVLQPEYSRSDRRFNSRQVIRSACVGSDRSGNERAVKVVKYSDRVKRGLHQGGDPAALNEWFLAWSFQANFMFRPVL